MSFPDNSRRILPAVHDVLGHTAIAVLKERHAHAAVADAIRAELADIRVRLTGGETLNGALDMDALAARIAARLDDDCRPRLRHVINATGIILHTNLGRAPMAEDAADAAYQAARGYLNLELDLDTGKRSSRQTPLRHWLRKLTGAESATVVNNNAAATVIALRALCHGKEVIVSRGQLIEIGGSFRIPEIMAVSGAVLREVGATNITRLSDYANAIGPETAALMQIHTSNFRISGFTESVATADLVALGREHNLPVIDDIGSGALLDFTRFGFSGEPTARASIAAGVDLVLFSGDKLLGGPQAGVIAGKAEWIQKIEKDPLMRAFRCDKMTLAALEATLRIYLNEEAALREIPVLHLLSVPVEELKKRAESLAERLRALGTLAAVEIAEDIAYVGGGSLPDQKMATWVVALRPCEGSDEDFARRLRLGAPAVLARLCDGNVVLDVRTVLADEWDSLIDAIGKAGA